MLHIYYELKMKSGFSELFIKRKITQIQEYFILYKNIKLQAQVVNIQEKIGCYSSLIAFIQF